VEQQLITFLSSTLNGSGIKIALQPSVYCEIVTKYLPCCTDITLIDVLKALVQAACDLQVQVTALAADMATLNADYDVNCLSGVTNSSDTHDVVQAVITKLCSVSSDLTALSLNVASNYVAVADINTYIATYLASIPSANKAYNNMVPFVAVEYYGPLANYPNPGDALSITGQGTGFWEKVYLCNGLNSTPDKRGRVAVGAISGVGGGPLSSDVNPATSPFNPNYGNGTLAGSNAVALTASQIPAHTHVLSIVDPGHVHPIGKFYSRYINYGTENSTPVLQKEPGANSSLITPVVDNSATTATTGITGTALTNVGGGGAHANNQPAIGCYYIMYKP